MKLFLRMGVMVVIFLLTCGLASADTTVGVTDSGNCYPFLCNDSGVSTGQTIDYQQVYSSGAFSGTQSINTLSFYFNPSFGGSSNVLSGTYDIYLSTTTATVNGLSSDPTANRGGDYTLVDVFTGLVDSNPSFTIALTSPFSYDPTSGNNLLLEVIASDQPILPNGSGNGYLAADSTGSTTSRAWGASTPLNLDPTGLVTTFNASPIATPEPGSITLLGIGLIALFSCRKVLHGSRVAA
jgi:PEP-CTERM motif